MSEVEYPHSGEWLDSEIVLFASGVRAHGWAKWTAISNDMKTRTAEQVRRFSRTAKGQAFRTVPTNVIGGLLDLAAGMKSVACSLAPVVELENKDL